jgi:hypothetical protein
MPDLHDLLDDSVGATPPFDLGDLARRRRRHRQRQVVALAAVVAVLAAVSGAFALGRASSDRHPAAAGARPDETTTTTPSTTAVGPAFTTTAPTLGTSPSPPPVGSPTTSAPTQPTSAAQPSTNPSAADLDGILVAAPTTATVGRPVTVGWAIRNRSGHEIVPDDNPTLGQEVDVPNPDVVALVCAPLDAGGRPLVPLGSDHLFVPSWSAPLASGSGIGESETFTPTADDIGTVTCEVVILDRSDGLSNLAIAGRVDAIAPVTITVGAAATPTTTVAPTTTTSP